MNLLFRKATAADLLGIVQMLANDALGAQREDASTPINLAYVAAFEAIEANPDCELIVVERENGRLVGTLQLTYIPNISHKGSWRCLIEGVRIQADFRRQGLGTRFFEWAIEQARIRGCKMVQLTADKSRADALRFYERLGFEATHEGLKLKLR